MKLLRRAFDLATWIWPDFWGCVFEVWPAPGARESLQKCGGLRDFGALPVIVPATIRPGRPFYGQEALLRNILCVMQLCFRSKETFRPAGDRNTAH